MTTISLGLALVHENSANNQTIQTILSAADIALYKAKETGRNRVISYDQLAA